MSEPEPARYQVSVIVPARNEQDTLAECLRSLVAQSETGFALGSEWQLLIVDDASTDRTRAIADSYAQQPGITILSAPALTTGSDAWLTGKANACWAGAQQAAGVLLAFTDADTVFEPGSISRARHELERYQVGLLSYSPRQLTSGLLVRVVMPLVFEELANAYPMQRVNRLEDRTAAANGQFLMLPAELYFNIGGHKAVGTEVLEDVALARNVKRRRTAIRFRYAPDALSARMYRSASAMIEGWTKNLALLLPNPLGTAAVRLLDLLLLLGLPALALLLPHLTNLQRSLIAVVWLRVVWRFYSRVARSNFPLADRLLAPLGLPLLLYLLVRSYYCVKVCHAVTWKGRTYRTGR